MKKILGIMSILSILFLFACGASDYSSDSPSLEEVLTENDANIVTPNENDRSVSYEDNLTLEEPMTATNTNTMSSGGRLIGSEIFSCFEELLEYVTTDVIIAQFIGQRPFGENLIEFEFMVKERVLGNAADTIFVYREILDFWNMRRRQEDLIFNYGTDYLLPLIAIDSPYAITRDNGHRFIRDFNVNLSDPLSSVMFSSTFGDCISERLTGLDFNGNVSRDDIVVHVRELTRHNPPARDIIRSEDIVDIISDSPSVVVVEINEPRRLLHELLSTDWISNDIYYVTAIQVLEGHFNAGDEFSVTFHANTVQTGEQHIVAIEPLEEGGNSYIFTSRNSLFRMAQLDEIISIIEEGAGEPK